MVHDIHYTHQVTCQTLLIVSQQLGQIKCCPCESTRTPLQFSVDPQLSDTHLSVLC